MHPSSPAGTLVGSLPQGGPVGEWRDISGYVGGAPSARSEFGFTFDPVLHALVLFGGRDNGNRPLGDTWEFQYGHWSDLSGRLKTTPAARYQAGMVFDPDLGALVLFGGQNGVRWFNDTWEFNGSWKQLAPQHAPSPRGVVAVAFDGKDDCILLFGGSRAGGRLGDTWEFYGGDWTNISSTLSVAPPPVQFTATYDASAQEVWLEGGRVGISCFARGINVTWTFAAGHWTNLTGALLRGPPADQGSTTLAYDAGAQGVVLFSGKSGAGCVSNNQTWVYLNAGWANVTGYVGPAPPANWGGGFAYDPAASADVLFGGNVYLTGGVNAYTNSTWMFNVTRLIIETTAQVAPKQVCVVGQASCGGPDSALLTMTVTVGVPTGNETIGVDDGQGHVQYLPALGAADPTLTYVGWASVSASVPTNDTVTCGAMVVRGIECPSKPITGSAGQGLTSFSWVWASSAGTPYLAPGDWWTIRITISALAPPYGITPVDRCATTVCRSTEGPSSSPYSSLQYNAFGSTQSESSSLPLATINVLYPASSSAPSPPLPPPPPPALPGPLPVGVPAPVPVATPIPAPIPAGVATVVSPSGASALAGIIAAGGTRAALRMNAQRVRVPVAIGRGPARGRVRGES